MGWLNVARNIAREELNKKFLPETKTLFLGLKVLALDKIYNHKTEASPQITTATVHYLGTAGVGAEIEPMLTAPPDELAKVA